MPLRSQLRSEAMPSNTAVANGEQSLAHLAGKYLTFKTGKEEYGLGILKVQEIIGMMKVTRVPRVQYCIRGVINLRGKVIPIIDLRRRLAMPEVPDTPRTCIIVVQTMREKYPVTMGLIVDEVSEVVDIPAEQIEASPHFSHEVQSEFLLGMGKVHKRVIVLLDIDRILATHDEQPAANEGKT